MENSNEKLAMAIMGLESEGTNFRMSEDSANELYNEDAAKKFNSAVDQYVDKFDKHRQELENYAKNLSEDMNGLEIMPLFGYVLIQPFEKNPFQQIKVSDSGIITDLGGMTPQYKSNETGQIEEENQFIKVGTVIETGHKCEFLKTGDIVFYTIASECMVPFFRQGFVVVNENRIIAVVNDKLTERRDTLKKNK